MKEILAAAVLNKNQNAFEQMMNIQYLTVFHLMPLLGLDNKMSPFLKHPGSLLVDS